MPQSSIAKLVLEDGTIFTGTPFGASAANTGEVVFNTAFCGYQEILTDPSYRQQLVTMAYTQIGNYGIADQTDDESATPQILGLIIKELSPIASNFRAIETLEQYLKRHNIPGIANIDTRALIRKLRTQGGGGVKGTLCTDPKLVQNDAELLKRTNAWPGIVGVDLVEQVQSSPKKPYEWNAGKGIWTLPTDNRHPTDYHIIAIDCGIKRGILRNLVQSGFRITVVPAKTNADAILAYKPDAIFISNGPGDPEPIQYVQNTLKKLIGQKPLFGIGLGHQLLALAMGAKTYKLKLGHRGGQPVQNVETRKVEMTAQNHGFAVDIPSLKANSGEPTHLNLHDQTLEGFRHTSAPVFAIQYNPEAAPGPHDATYLFDCFSEMIRTGRAPTAAQMSDAQKHRNAV
ncbi:MAG: glutamine-hydrolyzing carbamoyl-phosphate synthase small subunit [Phycisphaerales bacterium]|nr:glutamine-hydrolyzing carbamoyl-phosphate synthase small subunit [Phycisphaerales bacterium]